MNLSLRNKLPDILILIVLIVLGLKLAHDAWKFTDIWFYDESMYLSKGTTFQPLKSFYKDGFVYFIWYKLLSAFTTDKIDLYFLNNSILLVAPAIAMYVLLRVIKTNILFSFLSSVFFMLSISNNISWPFITKFALLVIMLGLSGVFLIKDNLNKLCMAILLSLLLTYIRPEFILTFSILCLIYLILVLRKFGFGINKNVASRIVLIMILFIPLILFNPVTNNRANLAFTQHYVKDINERRGNLDIQGMKDSDSIMTADFGGSVSMKDAIIRNPGKILEHIKFNVFRISSHIPYMIPMFFTGKLVNYIILIIIYCATLLAIVFLIKSFVEKQFTLFRLIYFLFALPTMLSIIFYFPRIHYTILIMALALVFFGHELSNYFKVRMLSEKYDRIGCVVLGLILILFVPLRTTTNSIHETSCTTLNILKAIRNYQLDENMNLLASGSGIQTYLGSNWNYLSPKNMDEPISDFVKKHNVNMILVNQFLLIHPKIGTDSIFNVLYEGNNFIKVNIPDCTSYLIIRSNLIK